MKNKIRYFEIKKECILWRLEDGRWYYRRYGDNEYDGDSRNRWYPDNPWGHKDLKDIKRIGKKYKRAFKEITEQEAFMRLL